MDPQGPVIRDDRPAGDLRSPGGARTPSSRTAGGGASPGRPQPERISSAAAITRSPATTAKISSIARSPGRSSSRLTVFGETRSIVLPPKGCTCTGPGSSPTRSWRLSSTPRLNASGWKCWIDCLSSRGRSTFFTMRRWVRLSKAETESRSSRGLRRRSTSSTQVCTSWRYIGLASWSEDFFRSRVDIVRLVTGVLISCESVAMKWLLASYLSRTRVTSRAITSTLA